MGSDLGWLFSLCLQEAEFAQFFFFSIGCFLLHPLNHSILHLFIHKRNSCVSTHGVQSVISTRGSKQSVVSGNLDEPTSKIQTLISKVHISGTRLSYWSEI